MIRCITYPAQGKVEARNEIKDSDPDRIHGAEVKATFR